MNKQLIVALSAALSLAACSKEKNNTVAPVKPVATIPVVPELETQTPVTGTTANNRGISYTQLNQELSYNKFITIDADGNGANDFYLTSVLIYHDGQAHMYLTASPVSKNGGMLQLDNTQELAINGKWAKPLDAGTMIGSAPATNATWESFMTKGIALDVMDGGTQGKTMNGLWVAKQDKYLAMSVRINNAVHYGWVRISHSAGEERMVVTGYAYNTVATESIKAGQTIK